MPIFGVNITYTNKQYGSIEVEAVDAKEAKRKANAFIKAASRGGRKDTIDWSWRHSDKYSVGELVEKITDVPVPDVQAVDMAFGNVDALPPIEKIPKTFLNNNSVWKDVVKHWFFSGLSKDVKFYPKEGVDAQKAYNALSAALRSFAPKHEHKEAGVAYLMSLWFEKVENWRDNKEAQQ